MKDLKQTPLYDIHKSNGAKLVEFAGYEMPVQYKGIIAEHQTVRSQVGLFDVSHMGEARIKGPDAEAFLQKLTTNDLSKISIGQAQYSLMLQEDGGVIDDLIIYKISDEEFFLILNAGNREKDVNWLQAHQTGNVSVQDESDALSLIALQGPNAEAVLKTLTPLVLSDISFYHFAFGEVAGVNVLVSRTGYTGEKGFELCVPNEKAGFIWQKLMEAGKDFGIQPIGLGARDTLRLEMGYSLYGHEIDSDINPIEAGLGWIVKPQKGDFIGKQACLEAKAEPRRKLTGLTLEGKFIPRQGYEVQNANHEKIGHVCSGTQSPSLNYPIATALIKAEYVSSEKPLFINIRNKPIEATRQKLPFLPKKTK